MRSKHKDERLSRLAALSLNYNVRFDGQYDDQGSKLLLALLANTRPVRKDKIRKRKKDQT
ncbi:hypothetical protein [Chitinophaga niabensis]|uniref:Uncharacterized protein n=1 Tax=Chitinophaga niabensis TaxID=536979 RepID=A0A1N6JXB0_9BACT|nr:hypothetical protein [Chitinophaga niabensis]SIO48960.1 hypothetical protein SAMN04488055_4632 [Chitinophaga niabensis]